MRIEHDDMGEVSGRAPPPLYEVIYRTLREHIAERRFPEGLIIGEAAVARAFRSSRIPAGVALRRLQDDGLLQNFDGRGFLAAREAGAAPLRLGLAEAGLKLPEALRSDLDIRNQRKRIYARIEHQIACCLPYGRFQVNESVLAATYGVSRTVAHEVLARLERAGLVAQDLNRRWYAGPLTRESMRDHFEMRWLLEPVALSQSAGALARDDLLGKRDRIRRARGMRLTARIVEKIEQDLHVDTVLRCRNLQLRDAIRRSQLPLIATHDSFKRYRDAQEMGALLDEHEAVLQHLIDERLSKAMAALESHLRRSVAPSIELMSRFHELPAARRAPYLTRIE
jgi:DNA-binding GntR family transcriptional regulator